MKLLLVAASIEGRDLIRRLTNKSGHTLTCLLEPGALPSRRIDYDLVLVESGVERTELLGAVQQIRTRSPGTPILSLGWLGGDAARQPVARTCAVVKTPDGGYVTHCQMRQKAAMTAAELLQQSLQADGEAVTFVYQG